VEGVRRFPPGDLLNSYSGEYGRTHTHSKAREKLTVISDNHLT
jgi:hypothetical protein